METRKLSTILFADIAGYTSLMQNNETLAMHQLNVFKEILEKNVPNYSGEIVQYFGDACLLAFDSAIDGVECAIKLQTGFKEEKIPIRLGMHLGDVIFKNNNVFGDGVNIASRIESMGIPGAILVSKAIRDQVSNKSEFLLVSLGSFEFKNVVEPMEVFALANPGFVVPDRNKISGKLKVQKNKPKLIKWLILIAVLMVSLLTFMWFQSNGNKDNPLSSIPKLAILDFVNEGNPIDNNLAEAITDELNSRMTGLKNLAIISRSSSKIYANSSKSLEEIGEELDVDYLLEGKVSWPTNTNNSQSIVIVPNLVRVSDNTSLWTEKFNHSSDMSQTSQFDITSQLLGKLDIEISTEENRRLNSSLTDNVLAYEAYIKGFKAKPPGHGAEVDYRIAFKMYKQAVALDPNFAQAWLGLSYVYKDLYWFGYEADPSTLDSAMLCIQRADKINPNDPLVTISLGDYYYRLREYDKSLVEFSKAMIERPNDKVLLQQIAEVWRRQGLFDQALETMEKCLELDPFSDNIITELSWTYIFVGNFNRALELQALSQKYNPDAEWNHLMGAMIHWCRDEDNDLDKARKLLENVPNPQSSYPAWFWVMQSNFENDQEAILNLTDNLSVTAFELQHSYEPLELVSGLALHELGRNKEAISKFEEARKILEEEVRKTPSDFRMHISLGLAYAGLGLKNEAVMSGKEATKLLPLELDSLLGLDILYGLMRIYAILGENDSALDVMAKLLSVPCQYRGLFFTANPEFKELQKIPRFQNLVERQNKMNDKFKI